MFGKPNNNSVKINCRKCGQPSESDKFILDPVYKMMVCPNCARERKSSSAMKKPSQSNPIASSEPMIPGISRASPNSVAAQQARAQAANAAAKSASGKTATPLGTAANNRAQMEAKLFPSSQPKPKPAEPARPAGWDDDDLELERLARQKASSSSSGSGQQVERISDEKVKITCAKCKYRFNYNVMTQTPSSCPNCGREIDKPRGFG